MKRDEVEAYYIAHYKALLFYALSFTHNREDAEDLVANAFVKAMLSFEDGNFMAWIYKVIQNEFYNLHRKKKRLLLTDEDGLEWLESPEDVLQNYIEQEQKRWLYAQIYQLPKRDRDVMLLSISKELADSDIAEITGISLANVRVIKHRVKQKLVDMHNRMD